MAQKPDDVVSVSLKMKKVLVQLIEEQCEHSRMPRSTWITQAVIDKLTRLGIEIPVKSKKENEEGNEDE
jgi:hypothetical protein